MRSICDSECCIRCNTCITVCKNGHEVPWDVGHRRVVTIGDGMIDAEKSVSVACIHCSGASCMAACPADCFYCAKDDVVLHDKDVYIGYGYCSYACPLGAPQFPSQGTFGMHGKMNKCTFYASGPEKNGSKERSEEYGHNRLTEGRLPPCAEMCPMKALLGGDNDAISDILRNQVVKRGEDAELFGWSTAYDDTQGKGNQTAPATLATPAKPASASGAQL